MNCMASNTKQKLRQGKPALGAWMLIGHPAVAEVLAGEGFDWIGVDLEHTATDLAAVENILRAAAPTGKDVLVRLSACDAVQAKRVLDLGANGIIVPNVNSRELARQAAAVARYPRAGVRGASLCRATDYGRKFDRYVRAHNREVLVVVMLEDWRAAECADEILSVPGIDAALIGPYDLSLSLGRPGQLDHPEVKAACRRFLAACRRQGVPPGIHVVAVDAKQIRQRIAQGYRFIACGLDTLFLMHGSRAMLGA